MRSDFSFKKVLTLNQISIYFCLQRATWFFPSHTFAATVLRLIHSVCDDYTVHTYIHAVTDVSLIRDKVSRQKQEGKTPACTDLDWRKIKRPINYLQPLIFSLSLMSTDCTISGCGEREEALKNWSKAIPEKAAPVTRTTLRTTGPVPADSRQ